MGSLIATLAAPGLAQNGEAPRDTAPNAQPAKAEAPAEQTGVEVKALDVTGRVLWRKNADADWQPLAEGDVIPVGASLRTMLRAEVRLQMGPDNTVTLDQLGTISLLEFAAEQDVLRTHLLKKYGRLEFDVESDGPFKNDFQLATPGSVLAVRGTRGTHTQYDRLKVEGDQGLFTLERPFGTVYLLGPKDLVTEELLAWVSDFIDKVIAHENDPNMGFGADDANQRKRYFVQYDRGAQERQGGESQSETKLQLKQLQEEEGFDFGGGDFGGDFGTPG
jgi:hypothetical protein